MCAYLCGLIERDRFFLDIALLKRPSVLFPGREAIVEICLQAQENFEKYKFCEPVPCLQIILLPQTAESGSEPGGQLPVWWELRPDSQEPWVCAAGPGRQKS